MSEILKLISEFKTKEKIGTISYLSLVQLPEDNQINPTNLGLQLKTVTFELENSSVSTKVNMDYINELKILSGIDHDEMLKNVLYNEMKQSKEKMVFNKIRELAKKSEFNDRTDYQKKLYKWFGYEPKTVILEESQIARRVIVLCNMVALKSRMGPGNFVIVGPRLGSLISDSNLFTFIKADENQWGNGLSYVSGILTGNIKVIVNPYLPFSDENIIVGRYTNSQNEGLYWVENESFIDQFSNSPDTMQLTLSQGIKLVETQRANLSYYIDRISNKKHTIFTFLWDKIKNKIKSYGK